MKSTQEQRRKYDLYKRNLGSAAEGLLFRMTGKTQCNEVSFYGMEYVLKTMQEMIGKQPGAGCGAEIIEMPRRWRDD